MKKETYIVQLIHRLYSANKLEYDEIEELEKWLDRFNDNPDIDDWLINNWIESCDQDVHISLQEIKEKIRNCDDGFSRFGIATNKSIYRNRARRLLNSYSIATAASLLLVFMSGFFAYYMGFFVLTNPIIAESISTECSEEKNVTLIVGEERQYVLTSETLELMEDGITIKGNNNQLALNKDTVATISPRKQIFSTIQVPLGKDYFLKLADGTKVWLNAGSTLKFPDYFTDDGRIVELTGEAFFDVKSDKSNPFFVREQETELRVTGTRFNVCNYTNETRSSVTLEEGKVEVAVNNNFYKLNPGERFEFVKESGQVNISEVNTSLYTSWKDGIYEFKDINLLDLTERLKKWYDVDFVFEKQPLKKLRFTGVVKKDYSIVYFLQVLEKTTNVQFLIDGDVILIQEEK
nr:FecR domain-containing protein [uncultured Draconibacterium sp.]